MRPSTGGRVRLSFAQPGFVLGAQRFIVVCSPLIESPQRPRRMAGQYVGCQQRECDCRIGVASHGIGQALRVDFAPCHRLAGGRAREPAGVGPRVGDLEKIVVTALGEAEDLLNLGLGLQDKILGASSTQDQDARFASFAFGGVDDGGGFVDVAECIDLELALLDDAA